MKTRLIFLSFALPCLGWSQQHDTTPSPALQQISFLAGSWHGTQSFVTGGAPLEGAATDNADWAIGGRYLEEHLSTTLPGRKPSDTRHFIGYDPKDQKFKAWWFNDTSPRPMELAGTCEGNVLTLESAPIDTPAGAATIFHAVYTKVSDSKITFSLSIKKGDSTTQLFTTTYTKS